MGKKKKEIELQTHRAIISLPKSAIAVDITCKIPDGLHGHSSVRMTLDTDAVWEAFRRAGDGYYYDEDESHAVPVSPNDDLALVYLPEDALFAHFECRGIAKTGGSEKIERTLTMVDIRRAFEYADNNYIDEDDRFVLTDSGREFAEELLGSMKA